MMSTKEPIFTRVINDLTKSQKRVKELEEKKKSMELRINRLEEHRDDLRKQVRYLQNRLYRANQSMYQRFKDYIKDRIDQW
tara:strand:+ start:473 stop:715 length:243 start_codon:yes stop_codon:yes gene_type:complete